jgi:pyruvate/2-oxoglutarate dehydrogenase complex dihydrolipoamide dehydrogenase (E3) component
VPGLALAAAAKTAAQVRRAGEFGLGPDGPVSVNFARVMERVRRMRAELSWNHSASRLKSMGVDVFFGEARFTGSHTVALDEKTLAFKRAILATGSHEIFPAISGLEEAGFLSRAAVFEIVRSPGRLAVVGDGPGGCEIAQAFLRLGCQVRLIVQGGQLLPGEDVETSAWLQEILAGEGLDIVLSAPLLEVEARGQKKVMRYEAAGQEHEAEVDEILVFGTRMPAVDSVGLQAAGVAFRRALGVEVDAGLATSQPHIWAAGSAAAGVAPQSAAVMGKAAARSALGKGKRRDFSYIPSCIHTDPEIAQIGASESELAGAGQAFENHVLFFRDLDRAILDGEEKGFIRLRVHPASKRVLGATLAGRRAGEVLAAWAPAFKRGAGLNEWSETLPAYPTLGEILHQAALKAGRGLGPRGFKTWLAKTRSWKK